MGETINAKHSCHIPHFSNQWQSLSWESWTLSSTTHSTSPWLAPQLSGVLYLTGCYGLNVCVPTQNSYVEILTSKVVVLGGGAFSRWLGHKVMSTFIKEAPGRDLLSFQPCEDTAKTHCVWTRKLFLTRLRICRCRDLDLPGLQNCEK